MSMPRRAHYFMAGLGANEVTNQNITAYVSNTTNGTAYGFSGRYDKNTAGFKVYGNPVQGASFGNLTNYSNADCLPRW